jgi:hypothetical protein
VHRQLLPYLERLDRWEGCGVPWAVEELWARLGERIGKEALKGEEREI